MHDHDERDPNLQTGLEDVAPPATFHAERVRARIETSLAANPSGAHLARTSARRAWLWTARAAAGLAVFLGGALYGRYAAPAAVSPAAAPAIAFPAPDAVSPAQVALTIQGYGTGYVASLALLAEMRDRLTPEQRDEARQVALAALSGAMAELAAAEGGHLPGAVLRTVLHHGVAAGGPGNPVVRYQ